MLDARCTTCGVMLTDHEDNAGTDAAPLCRQCAEPVTEDWLEEIGFRRVKDWPDKLSRVYRVRTHDCGEAQITVVFGDGDMLAWAVNSQILPRRAWPTTRAGVRDLCRVLGVEVKL